MVSPHPIDQCTDVGTGVHTSTHCVHYSPPSIDQCTDVGTDVLHPPTYPPIHTSKTFFSAYNHFLLNGFIDNIYILMSFIGADI